MRHDSDIDFYPEGRKPTIDYPNFDHIIAECKKEIDVKYEKYLNEWKNHPDKKWWFARLENEIIELKHCLTVEEEKRKYINIINLASMAYDMRQPHTHDTEPGTKYGATFQTHCKTCGRLRFTYNGKSYEGTPSKPSVHFS